MNISRKAFILGSTGAIVGGCTTTPTSQEKHDPNLSVFISDMHIPALDIPLDDKRDAKTPTACYDHCSEIIDQILAMRPLPARVIGLGDVAYLRGRAADYRHSKPIFTRLGDAGIQLLLGIGNHDHRAAFAEVWPDQAKASPVPGFIVRECSLGTVDFVLLDTLQENPMQESKNPGDGLISKPQSDWLTKVLAERSRPFILGGHHSCRETKMGNGTLCDFIMRTSNCRGYVHGHDHSWNRRPLYQWYGEHAVKREITVPSTGFWGDIGYVVCNTCATHAEFSLVQNDFYFRSYRPKGASRPPEWAEIVRENADETCRILL